MSTYVSFNGDLVTSPDFGWECWEHCTFANQPEWFNGNHWCSTAFTPDGQYWQVCWLEGGDGEPDGVTHVPCFIGPAPA